MRGCVHRLGSNMQCHGRDHISGIKGCRKMHIVLA